MRKTADAVIIGGGALGSSILYHLTTKGLRNVVLLEKGELCSGGTGDSAAIVRQHYSNEVSILLVKKSVEIFHHFPEIFDGAQVFHNTGWFFLVPPEAGAVFQENMARLQRLGVRTWEITPQEAAADIPGLNTAGIGRVAFEPDSGYAEPYGMVSAFVAKAKAQGAEVLTYTPARNIRLEQGRISTVVTDQGEISTPIVVNAAGPWGKEVGRWVGLDLPLEISREQEIMVEPPADMPPLRRTVSNMVDRTYFRPEAGGLILVGVGHPKENEAADPNNYRRGANQEFVEDTARRIAHRIPALERGKVIKSWAGLYDITPDWNMLLGKSDEVEGLYLSVGGSGHSFKLAPAMGLCLAELIVDGKASTVDITPLRPSRFSDNAALRSTYGGNRA
ncbi:MAG: FAD-binding oxidoreductase [Chloroflexi bacterium]|nr:FAD-binding oxidoreductase [Chloroflexota bacterium]